MTDEEKIRYINRCPDKEATVVVIWEALEQECQKITVGDVADIINRQQVEIEYLQAYKEALINGQETLQKEIERLRENNKAIMQTIADVHTEARKEFAEQVKLEFYKEFDEIIPSIMADRIDNIVKEKVGDDS